MVCVGTLCDTRKLVRLSCDVSLSAAGVCSTSNPPLGGDIACAFPDFMSFVEKKGSISNRCSESVVDCQILEFEAFQILFDSSGTVDVPFICSCYVCMKACPASTLICIYWFMLSLKAHPSETIIIDYQCLSAVKSEERESF